MRIYYRLHLPVADFYHRDSFWPQSANSRHRHDDLEEGERMQINPTSKTAAIGGIWSSVGLTVFEAWSEQAKFASTTASNLASLTSAALFFFLPVFFLVIGQNTGAFSRFWFLDEDERVEYWIVVKRMIVWFVSVCVSGLILSAFVST